MGGRWQIDEWVGTVPAVVFRASRAARARVGRRLSGDAAGQAGGQLDSQAALATYQRSYIQRLQSCMAEQFPALCHALGKDLFLAFSREFLRSQPPTSHSLYDLGRGFEGWLDAHRPDQDSSAGREAWIDFMVDLAGYEHALFRLYDAPGCEGLPALAPERSDAEICLVPCLRLYRARFPVAAYYHAVKLGHDPELPPAREVYYALVRRDYVTTTYPLTAMHHDFLAAMVTHGDIDPALADLASRLGHALSDVRRSWQQRVRGAWIDAGFFTERR